MGYKKFMFGAGIQAIHLKRDLFSLLINATILASAGFLVMALLFGKHPLAILSYALLLIFNIAQYFLTRKFRGDRKQGHLYIAYILVENCILLPALYITGGGIDSGLSITYVLAGLAILVLLDGIYLILSLILTGITLGGAYMYDYLHPGFTEQFTVLSPALSHIEIALASIAIGFGAGLFLRIITKDFEINQEKARELLLEIRESSVKDPLTGAYNRRYLMDYLEECIKKVDSGEMRAFSILMFDIDHFKKINDTYGHLAGDDCIHNLSCILKSSLRNIDVVSRYGGEEFICVLPTAEDTPAFRRAEQIRESVELTQLSQDINKKVTVSGGVVMYTPGMTPEQLIAEADENLYLAKEGGRNQVVWHKGGIPPLCYIAYDTTVLSPVHNAGRRFSDATADLNIQKA